MKEELLNPREKHKENKGLLQEREDSLEEELNWLNKIPEQGYKT